MSQQISEKAKQFALQYGLDPNTVELSLLGVLSRVEVAMSNGHQLTQELIEKAFRHWHISQERYYQELLQNKDGKLDVLSQQVYSQLKGKINATH